MHPYFISGQCSLFIPEHRSIKREHRPEIDSGTSFSLIQIQIFLYTWRMTSKICWFYQPNLVGMGISVSNIPFTVKQLSIASLIFPVRSVWLHSLINSLYFKIGVLKNFWTFTGKNLCQSLFLIKLQPRGPAAFKKKFQCRCFPVKFAKFLRMPFFTKQLPSLLL